VEAGLAASLAASKVSRRHRNTVIRATEHRRVRETTGTSGLASGQVLGTPTLFIDGTVYRGGYDPPALLAALAA